MAGLRCHVEAAATLTTAAIRSAFLAPAHPLEDGRNPHLMAAVLLALVDAQRLVQDLVDRDRGSRGEVLLHGHVPRVARGTAGDLVARLVDDGLIRQPPRFACPIERDRLGPQLVSL